MSDLLPLGRGRSKAVTIVLGGALLFLVFVAANTSLLIIRHQATLREVSRYNITWLISQAALEVARLHGTVAAAMVPGSGVDDDDVDLRLDIMANRVGLFEDGDVVRFVSRSPELMTIVKEFRTAAAAARAEMDRTASPGRLLRMLKLVADINAPLARLAAAANAYGGEQVTQDQQQLSKLHWTFAAALAATALCGFGLVGALTWNNRRLVRTEWQNSTLRIRDHELNIQNARFDAALNNMSQALCMMDAEQRLIVCNVRFLDLFGISEQSARPGALAADIFRDIAGIGRYDPAMISAMSERQSQQAHARASCSFAEEDESGRALAVSQEPMGDGGWVATFEDITERRRTEAQITFMAHHDALTGLPNRVLFHTRLQQALQRFNSRTESVAILCLDLDQFKKVNDTLGHPAGDALLITVAGRLQSCVRDDDLVVRLGGDEFAILQIGAVQPEASQALARRVIEELGQAHEIDGHRVFAGASVGIAIAAPGLTAADALLKGADIALYSAKADGRGTFRLFEKAMDTEMQMRRMIEADLREALRRNELQVYYQPLINLTANEVCGFEALLRWRHPTRGMISPEVFIPIAEELGLIVAIGEWTLNRACHDAVKWPDHLKVAVNLSPMQFRAQGLVAAVRAALEASGMAPARLELEITESALLEDSQTVLAMLHELGALGLRIALDDFGTGYSSLSYLRSFPFSKVKIDQSFIREMASRPDCEAIVRSVTSLAHTLGMTTTAEGVETEEHLLRLRDTGCTEVQGFLFDRPKPAGEIGRWLETDGIDGTCGRARRSEPALRQVAAALAGR